MIPITLDAAVAHTWLPDLAVARQAPLVLGGIVAQFPALYCEPNVSLKSQHTVLLISLSKQFCSACQSSGALLPCPLQNACDASPIS